MRKTENHDAQKRQLDRRTFFGGLLLMPGIAWFTTIFTQVGCAENEEESPSTDVVGGDDSQEWVDTNKPLTDTTSEADTWVEPEDAEEENDVVAADTNVTEPDTAVELDTVGEPDVSTEPDIVAEPDVEVPDPICEITEPDALGPFYQAGAPQTHNFADPSEPGELIFIEGQVFGPDCETPLAGATVDVWHADDNGDYHDGKLRGVIMTDENGYYAFASIKAGAYALGGSFRPSHFHFMVSAPGHEQVVTQLYFEGDPFLSPNDPCGPPTCFSDDKNRIIPLTENIGDNGEVALEGVFNINLA
jgi:protocatechuate 3,4-dioxygenase beta subunit